MIGAYLSFSVVQASLPGLLASRAFPPFSLLTKRIPDLPDKQYAVGEGLKIWEIELSNGSDPPRPT